MYRLVDSQLSVEQQCLLQELIDAIPDPIFIKDSTGKYLLCNRAFEHLTGVATDAIHGKTAYDLFPAQLAESFTHRDQELFDRHSPVTSETWVAYRMAGGPASRCCVRPSWARPMRWSD